MKPGPPSLPEYPRLHPGCRFVLHSFEKGPSWVLENPSTGKFFRMGLREERMARRLDGMRNVPELLTLLPEAGSEEELSHAELPQFLLALKNGGLLEGDSESAAPVKPLFNPMFLRIPFGSPDKIFGKMADAFRRIPLWPIGLLLLGITLSGAYQVLANLDRFNATMGAVFSAENIPGFMAVFITLKILHETAHGVVCRYFGGRVPDAGLYFIFFIPMTYIDATASWRFPSKWIRILVSSAGMLSELVVAAIAGLIWAATPPGVLNTIASNAVISASVTTLLFNANPLMRFDGYFILTDLSGYPNLYQLATRASSAFLGRILLGIPATVRYPTWITVYGIACLFWRTTLVFSIAIGAIALLHGIGIVLAVLTLAGSYLPLIKRLPKQLAALRERKVKLSRWRLGALVLIGLTILFVPLEPAPTSPAVIEPAGMTTLRVQCPGFVREIVAQPGQSVEAGQLLIRLDNPDEKSRRDQLKADALRAEASANQLRESGGESKLMAQHLEQALGLRTQAGQVTEWLDTLSLKAPVAGALYVRELDDLMGTFLQTGKEVLRIGSAQEREAQVAVSQELFDRIRPKVGESIQILIPGRMRTFTAVVTNVESAATRNIRHESLTALAGGPLPVNRSAAKNSREANSSGMELVDPHFYVTAKLAGNDTGELIPGEGGVVRFPSAPRRTLLEAALAAIRQFIQRSSDKVTTPQSPG